MQVKHAEFIESVAPLIELVGEDVNGIFTDVEIKAVEDPSNPAWMTVRVLRATDPGDGTEPVTVGEDEHAEQAWPLTGEVV